jgi:hypothetical protein
VLACSVAVEKLAHLELAKIGSRSTNDSSQSLDIFYHSIFDFLRKTEFFNSHSSSHHESQAPTIHGNKDDKWATSRSGLTGENRWPGELRNSGPSVRPKTYAVTCFTSGTVLISTLCGRAATVTGAVTSSTPL